MRVAPPGDQVAGHTQRLTGFGVGVGWRVKNLAAERVFVSALALWETPARSGFGQQRWAVIGRE